VRDTIEKLMRRGVVVRNRHQQHDLRRGHQRPHPDGREDSIIAFMAATAQAQAEATKAAQRYGIEAARQEGRRYLGRKHPSPATSSPLW
jgi:putative DNA-invertase from lambdoid prophage Rac